MLRKGLILVGLTISAACSGEPNSSSEGPGFSDQAIRSIASDLAVRTICEVAQRSEADAPPEEAGLEELLDRAFQSANNTIKEEAEKRKKLEEEATPGQMLGV